MRGKGVFRGLSRKGSFGLANQRLQPLGHLSKPIQIPCLDRIAILHVPPARWQVDSSAPVDRPNSVQIPKGMPLLSPRVPIKGCRRVKNKTSETGDQPAAQRLVEGGKHVRPEATAELAPFRERHCAAATGQRSALSCIIPLREVPLTLGVH
jgi:hypothetical protein